MVLIVWVCIAIPTIGQTAVWKGLYARSTELINSGRLEEHSQLVDSLAELNDAGQARIHRLLLARHLRHTGQLVRAHHLLDSLASAGPAPDPYLAYLNHYQQAKSLQDLEIYDKAKAQAQLAIGAAKQAALSKEASKMSLLICEVELHSDRLREALECFEINLAQSRKEKNIEGICRALIGMGNAYYFQEQDSAALAYYEEAYAVAKAEQDPGLLVSALLNIGASLSYTAGPDSALALYRAVLDTADQASVPLRFRADILGNMASMHSDLDQHEAALTILDSAMLIYSSLYDTASLAQSHLYKATALWQVNRRNEAVEQAMLARARTRSTDLKAKATKKAADYLKAMGRAQESLDLLSEYTELADSVARSRYNTGVAGAQVRFETAEKERRIAEQDQALALAAAEDRRKSVQRNALIGATAFLVLIALLLYRSMRNRQRLATQQKELHDKQVDQLLAQQELQSINAMLEGQESERDRMGRDLHDRLGSMLGGIKANLAALEDRVQAMREDQQYQKVNKLLDQTVSELRQISHDMAAATLSRFGLEKALNDLRDTLHINGRLHVELNTFGLDQRLERSMEIAVYRIIQELVSNVLKHAKASELTIGVTRAPGRLSVVVSDNGVGFDPSSVSSGMGLSNVRSRATAIGATVQVDSAPRKGTTVSVECVVVE